MGKKKTEAAYISSADDPVPLITRMQAMEVHPGDIILITVPKETPVEQLKVIQKIMDLVLADKDAKSLIVQEGISFQVVRDALINSEPES